MLHCILQQDTNTVSFGLQFFPIPFTRLHFFYGRYLQQKLVYTSVSYNFFFLIVLQLGKVILCSFSHLETASIKTYDNCSIFLLWYFPIIKIKRAHLTVN